MTEQRELDSNLLKRGLESIEYIDGLIREYLVFRGFTDTLVAFEKEGKKDINKKFKPKHIVKELLARAEALEIDKLIEYWEYLDSRFFKLKGLENDRVTKLFLKRLQRYFIVCASRKSERERIENFYEKHGHELAKDPEWISWFAINYVSDPENHPKFSTYFTKEWIKVLKSTLEEYMNTIFPETELPKILMFESEWRERKRLELNIKELEKKVVEMGAAHMISTSFVQPSIFSETNTGISQAPAKTIGILRKNKIEQIPEIGEGETSKDFEPELHLTNLIINSNQFENPHNERRIEIKKQQSYLEHPSAVISALFSPSGDKVASLDEDNCLKIWSHRLESYVPKKQGFLSPIEVITWESKLDHLVYLGSEDGKIRAYNTETEILHDHYSYFDGTNQMLYTMKSNPVFPSLLLATGQPYYNSIGSGGNKLKLQVLDTNSNKIAKIIDVNFDSVLDIQSINFNHNGNLAAVSSSSGKIIVYDLISAQPVFNIDINSPRSSSSGGGSGGSGSGSSLGGKSKNIDRLCMGVFNFDETSIHVVSEFGKLQQWSLRSQKSELVSESVLKLPDLNNLDKINKSGTMSSTPPISATSFYNSSRSIAPGSISNNSHGVTTAGNSGISSRSGLGIFKTPLSPSNVCFSPETDHVLIAPENYGVIYDVGLGTWSEVLAPHRYPITCVDWDSTGGSILTASEDGTIRIATL